MPSLTADDILRRYQAVQVTTEQVERALHLGKALAGLSGPFAQFARDLYGQNYDDLTRKQRRRVLTYAAL